MSGIGRALSSSCYRPVAAHRPCPPLQARLRRPLPLALPLPGGARRQLVSGYLATVRRHHRHWQHLTALWALRPSVTNYKHARRCFERKKSYACARCAVALCFVCSFQFEMALSRGPDKLHQAGSRYLISLQVSYPGPSTAHATGSWPWRASRTSPLAHGLCTLSPYVEVTDGL